MEVIRAEYAGACYGVDRALKIVDGVLAQGAQVSSLGPIIHNPRVVAQLAQRGLTVVADPADVQTEKVLIRSHGVTPDQRRQLEASGASIVDATCPYVLRAQRAAASLGAKYGAVIVVGEAGHPEVDGLMAYIRESGSRPVVASAPVDLPADLPAQVGVVVQTTQRLVVLEAILAALDVAGIAADTVNTICHATTQRQDAAQAVASQVDAMVVLGGKNSSNTTRLAEISATVCSRVFHIEDASELQPADLAGCRTIGLTAGASTPESQIVAVEDALRGL